MAAPALSTKLTSPDNKFSCWIETDHPLVVYNAQRAAHAATAHIASEEGKSYSVHVKFPNTRPRGHYKEYQAHLVIDGSLNTRQHSNTGNRKFSTTFHSVHVGRQDRRLLFAKPTLVDAEPVSEALAKALSTIKVTVRRVRVDRSVVFRQENTTNSVVGNIPERNKKARVASVTSLGAAKPAGNRYICEVKPAHRENPLYTFTFTYMPLDVLQAFGFVPRHLGANDEEDNDDEGGIRSDEGPIVVKDESDDGDYDSSSEDEDDDEESEKRAEELRQQLALLEAKIQGKGKKRALDDEDVKPAVAMKRRLKRAAKKNGGVVDLTGGDEEE